MERKGKIDGVDREKGGGRGSSRNERNKAETQRETVGGVVGRGGSRDRLR